MFVHKYQKRIRYGETDKMGYLYYGNYPLMYEIGRVEALRSLGITYAHMEDDLGIIMPVVFVSGRYLQPLYYDELITIETRLESRPSKMIHFLHTIYNEKGTRVHEGEVKLFFVKTDTQQRISAPEYLTSKINAYFD